MTATSVCDASNSLLAVLQFLILYSNFTSNFLVTFDFEMLLHNCNQRIIIIYFLRAK